MARSWPSQSARSWAPSSSSWPLPRPWRLHTVAQAVLFASFTPTAISATLIETKGADGIDGNQTTSSHDSARSCVRGPAITGSAPCHYYRHPEWRLRPRTSGAGDASSAYQPGRWPCEWNTLLPLCRRADPRLAPGPEIRHVSIFLHPISSQRHRRCLEMAVQSIAVIGCLAVLRYLDALHT